MANAIGIGDFYYTEAGVTFLLNQDGTALLNQDGTELEPN